MEITALRAQLSQLEEENLGLKKQYFTLVK